MLAMIELKLPKDKEHLAEIDILRVIQTTPEAGHNFFVLSQLQLELTPQIWREVIVCVINQAARQLVDDLEGGTGWAKDLQRPDMGNAPPEIARAMNMASMKAGIIKGVVGQLSGGALYAKQPDNSGLKV
jgi:hypothetical protein